MQMLLGLAPFIVFALLTRIAASTVSLWAGAAVSAVLILRERMHGKSLKILEVGTLTLFSLLAIYTSLSHAKWSVPAVRAVVDSGLLLIVVLSLVVRRPFTLSYALEETPAKVHQSPQFIRINYVITSVWALALAVVVAADFIMAFSPGSAVWGSAAAIVAALAGAFWFTRWYPEQQQRTQRQS